MIKFKLKKESCILVKKLFHDDKANHLINLETQSEDWVNLGISLNHLEKVNEITPIEELLNHLSNHFKEIKNNNVIDKEYWIQKCNSIRIDKAKVLLLKFLEYYKEVSIFENKKDEINFIDDFLINEENKKIFFWYRNEDDYIKGWEDGIEFQKNIVIGKSE